MTEGLMPEEVLAALKPGAVVPAMLVLAHERAPTRPIWCAGAGTFDVAYTTLTQGSHRGLGADMPAQLAAQLAARLAAQLAARLAAQLAAQLAETTATVPVLKYHKAAQPRAPTKWARPWRQGFDPASGGHRCAVLSSG
jgi:hypothetical protein